MAYLDQTLLLDFQARQATDETRYDAHGLVDMVRDSTAGVDYIPPSALERMSSLSSLRDAQLPVIKDTEVTVTTSPSFTIPANLGETDEYTFVAYDVFSGMRFYPASFANNSVDADFYYDSRMRKILDGCATQIESIIEARLEERKTQLLDFTTQVSQGDGTFNFNTTGDILEVNKAAQKETMFYNLQQLMDANKVGGNYRLTTSRAGLSVQISEAAKFGLNNEKNLQALGMLPMDRIYESDLLQAGSDIFNGWMIRDGAMGFYENFPYDFANGTQFAGKQWSISDTALPFTNMRANVYVNTEATDATALVSAGRDSNLEMTHFEEMALWFRFYIVYRYNSDLATRPQDIVKIKGLTT